MFTKLRTKFILINLLTTSIVLIIAFSSIYLIASNSNNHRPPISPSDDFNKDVTAIINERLHADRQASLESLLISLIVTGIGIEIAVLFISFYLADQAIKPVKNTYLAQKEFIANASHEIKTPLAAIQANLEAADIKNNRWIDNVSLKTAELARLNTQLLTLARVEAADVKIEKEKITLKPFIEEVISPLEPQIKKQKKDLKIRTHNLKKPEIFADKATLSQLLNILIDNAIKYSDKKITIVLSDNTIKVKNDGTVIEKDKLPHIFDRFYQTDKTKSGVGLGLAIAQKLATANNWKLSADSSKTETIFTIEL
ncbi:HAMP domain-containing histidine kinase [Candidatus Saccharibacteria bacterium]|nr:HAMP domain-containing histidine kinase [Candidatus Saccharibacteria bacterium]